MSRLLLPALLVATLAASTLAQSPDWLFDRYVKASNPGAEDNYGYSIAISGTTLVVGAPFEDSGATGVNGNQASNSVASSGAVYVYRLTPGATGQWGWTQTAYLKASNANAHDAFGYSVDIDGDILVVGAPKEASASSTVNNNPLDNSAEGSGAAYVFVRTMLGGIETWSQQAYLKASNSQGDLPNDPFGDRFGSSVAVSGDLIAVGAPWEDGGSTSINGPQGDESAYDAGAAYVFRRAGASFWYQEAYVKPSIVTGGFLLVSGGVFGDSLALSGNRLLVGAPRTYITGDAQGMAFLFERSSTTGLWTERESFQSAQPSIDAYYGDDVDIDGNRCVVGEPYADAPGKPDSGAAHIYRPSTNPLSNAWVLEATLRPAQGDVDDYFGSSVAISADMVAVGAPAEDGSSTGVAGDPFNDAASDAGAVYTWRRNSAGAWTDARYVKASNTNAYDEFGFAVDLDGALLAVGATREDGASTSGPFAPFDNSAQDAGAAYLYHRLADCNLNGIDDPAEVATQDCNQNGAIDSCEVASGVGDCDGNLVPDTCQGDTNQDGILDACQSGGVGFCFGEGTGVACPCANSGSAGGGCANSANAAGGRLVATGLPFVANDTLRLVGTGMTPTSSVLYFQGTTQSSGTIFGDGLRCATGAVIRLGTTANVGGASQWPVPGAQAISVRGAIPAQGGVSRTYQAWYRDANATFCTDSARFNLTNGVLVQWLP